MTIILDQQCHTAYIHFQYMLTEFSTNQQKWISLGSPRNLKHPQRGFDLSHKLSHE